jgi:hypothetical protein
MTSIVRGGFGLIGCPNQSALLLLDDISRSAIPVNHSAANFDEQTLFLKHILLYISSNFYPIARFGKEH